MFLDLMAVFVGLIILWRINTMSAELARLQTEVAENTTVIASAAALIESLAGTIRDNAEDPAALNALADQLDENSSKLSAAVATNTPATNTTTETIPPADLEPIVEAPPADDTVVDPNA